MGDILESLGCLPTGFVQNPYRGLGLNYDLRLILPYAVFEAARKEIGRIHDQALRAARAEKATRLQDRLLNPIDPARFPVVGQPYHPDAIVKAVGDGVRLGLELSPADAAVLIDAASGLIEEVAQREPSQLLKLTEAVETVTIEAMIAHMQSRLAARHGEDNWQKFLTDNAFILRLAFGVPVILFRGQATVGGRTYSGVGDKRTDFLVQAAKSGNLSIIEIKTPDTDLLEKREYRGGIHAPHAHLSGAVAQVLDQRWQLQETM